MGSSWRNMEKSLLRLMYIVDGDGDARAPGTEELRESTASPSTEAMVVFDWLFGTRVARKRRLERLWNMSEIQQWLGNS